MSAHHWRNVPAALREMRRVLTPGGKVVLIDIAGTEDPLRDYTGPAWRAMFEAAGFAANDIGVSPAWRIGIEFASWVRRMRTAPVAVEAIRREHYRVQADGSFDLEAVMVTARSR